MTTEELLGNQIEQLARRLESLKSNPWQLISHTDLVHLAGSLRDRQKINFCPRCSEILEIIESELTRK